MFTDLQAFIEILQKSAEGLGVTKEEAGAHAGESEVSLMLWAKRALVRDGKISEAEGYTGKFGEEQKERIFRKGIDDLSSIGVLGSPLKASAGHGDIYIYIT